MIHPGYCDMCQRLTRAEAERRHPDAAIYPPDCGSVAVVCPHCGQERKVPAPGVPWFCTCQICDCPTRDVAELVNTRGEVLHVGQAVDISLTRSKPGIVLALHAAELPKHHRALVRYDGDDPTPAHVMAHQCRPRLDGPRGQV